MHPTGILSCLFTARNDVRASDSVHRGEGSVSVHAGIPPWQGDTPPLRTACWEIQSTNGRYACNLVYGNKVLFYER